MSKIALGEYFKNLTYQALSQENNNIFLCFCYGSSLIHSLLEAFKTKEKNEVENSEILGRKINEKLDIKFEEVLQHKYNLVLKKVKLNMNQNQLNFQLR